MKNAVNYFEDINIEVPYKYIYTRLGFRKGITEINKNKKKELDSVIEEAVLSIELKGCATIVPIERLTEDGVFLENGLVFKSKNLSKFLKDSISVVIMAATSGKKIMNKIKNFSKENLEKGVIYDAVASEITDSALDWIMNYYNQMLKREGKTLTQNRFSAGYGDLDLSNQKKIYDLLDLKKIGIDITSDYILIPEKSVSAIAGVKNILEK